jgi:autotransporter translocation and assembly factor TamB
MSQRVSLAERAGTMAAGAIATPLADSVARALNLDLFEIQAPAGDSKAPAVALGSQIGTRLYIGVRQEIGYDEGSALSLEYRLAEFMRVVTSVAQAAQHGRTLGRNEAGGVDLYFVFRY